MAGRAHTHSVSIPEDLHVLLLAKLTEQQVSAWASEALIAEAARRHVISRRKAASLLVLTKYDEREAFFERHGLTNEYTVEMVEEDFKALDTLREGR